MNDHSFEEHDPFAPPAAAVAATQPADRRLPPYCTTMFIVSLVVSIIRIPFTFLSVIGCASLAAEGFSDGNALAVFLEVISGIGMVVFGIAANIALLCRKTWGLTVAHGLVISVLLSYAGAFLAIAELAAAQNNPAACMGMYLVGTAGVAARIVLLMAYLLALWKFSEWMQSGSSLRNWI